MKSTFYYSELFFALLCINECTEKYNTDATQVQPQVQP